MGTYIYAVLNANWCVFVCHYCMLGSICVVYDYIMVNDSSAADQFLIFCSTTPTCMPHLYDVLTAGKQIKSIKNGEKSLQCKYLTDSAYGMVTISGYKHNKCKDYCFPSNTAASFQLSA